MGSAVHMEQMKHYVEYALNVSDLILDPEFLLAYQHKDEEKINERLYHFGMDISKMKPEVGEFLHRNVQGEVCYGARYMGIERMDNDWFENGAPTLEAQIAAVNDPFLRKELRIMKYETNQDQAFTNPSKIKGSILEVQQ